jgi:hypothetical protein
MSQSVLILGSQGILGSLVADAFRKDGWTITGSSRRGNAAPGVRHVDLADPGTLEDALDDVKPDLVVSTVPDATLAAERAVLRRGGLIFNTSTLPAADARRLAAATVPATANGDAAGAGQPQAAAPAPHGTVVAHTGIAPGLVNLVAATLLADHPDADEIEMAFTNSVKGTVGQHKPEAIQQLEEMPTSRHNKARRHATEMTTSLRTDDIFSESLQRGSGGLGESHPQAPTDPGVTVSRHRAPLILLARNYEPTSNAGRARGSDLPDVSMPFPPS